MLEFQWTDNKVTLAICLATNCWDHDTEMSGEKFAKYGQRKQSKLIHIISEEVSIIKEKLFSLLNLKYWYLAVRADSLLTKVIYVPDFWRLPAWPTG